MLDIQECITEALKVGKIDFAESNIRPGESIGIGSKNPVQVRVTVVVVEGKDVIVYTLPQVSSMIYATDSLVKFSQTLLEKRSMVILGSNRKGSRNRLSMDTLRSLQNNSGVYSTEYGFVNYATRDELLTKLAV